MKRFFRYFRSVMGVILLLAVLYAAFNFDLVSYGFGQLRGQLKIVFNAKPIREVMEDPATPDSVRAQLAYIEEVKRFAIDSIGLKESKNYTTFYDQEGLPVLWTLTASEAFSMTPYLWKFPLLGEVSYKGFFNYEKGRKEQERMIEEGYDTDFGTVSAWSTLGWFRDPILSGMLRRSKGDLAELIIHELTHATIYLKSNVDLNENLASLCGEQGAIRFLSSTYGSASDELIHYLQRKEDYDKFSNHMLLGKERLDSLYQSLKDSATIQKLAEKRKLISKIVASLDTVSFHAPGRFNRFDSLPNNAYFLNFVRYDSEKEKMRMELVNDFQGDIGRYIEYLRKKD